jgi:hypothetical protein
MNITYIVINERRMNSQYVQKNFIIPVFLLNIEYQELHQWIYYIGWSQNFGIFTFNPLDFLFKKTCNFK